MTDYLRPVAAYVATLGGHNHHPDRTLLSNADTPATQADTTVEDAADSTERGRTR